MGSEFAFYDYIDADGDETNVINCWLNGEGKDAKADFNRTIGYLEVSPPAGHNDSVWHPPFVRYLSGKWKGFIELRKKTKGIQYRLVGKIEERDVLLVTWGYHKGSWEADITPLSAKERVNQMRKYPQKYRRAHDNS